MANFKTDVTLDKNPRHEVSLTKAHELGSDSATTSKTNPRSRQVNRSSRANTSAYQAFSSNLYRDLNPRGPLERLMSDHVIQCAWRFKGTLDRQSARGFEDSANVTTENPRRVTRSAAERASRSLREALESLDYLRVHHRYEDAVVVESPVASEVEIVEVEPVAEPENWRDRLIFDFDISDISPVVKGTWITVSYVVSLIVDGWNWADILRSHPELSEDDIQTCVSYAMAEENATV